MTGRVNRVNICHHANFRGDWSNRSQDMAVFDFSKWRPFAILDMLYARLDHTRRIDGGLYRGAQFG